MEDLEPGTIFADRYEILALLGRGGMGQVYRAVDVELCREVALKILGAHVMHDCEARFEREAHAIARLDHPGCVRIVDHGRARDRQYIAMDLLDGPSLSVVLEREGQLSIARAIYIADRLLAALGHAHAHGVCHRDVKPENIVLRDAARPVLIDFGLASLRDDAALTQRGMCVGSPSYVAPERLIGQPHDARADLYAVGVILYEMLAGLRPFVGSTSREIMQNALERPPRPLRALRSDVSPELEGVIMRALAKDPDRRFADADEMRARIAAAGEVTGSEPRSTQVSITRDEADSTMIRLAVTRGSIWRRCWSWLRYGRWHWHPSRPT